MQTNDGRGKRFFTAFDKAAFWVATLATFAVYFYTLGPSVGLEDSGELATAGAHLGVPHPPGYPFWTFCAWTFCKLFSFVEYMGHPTPAWAISCLSAVFGAFAAGCTAMLICRSAGDFIAGSGDSPASGWLCFGGGVGGALAFAFSPVEWSQSTIVEIYSLNSLFLMWVFLLSYTWMRKPSDRVLWLTALVFGLGLTNYQVILFAMVPLAIMICLKNFRLFRDFAMYLIPAAMTWQLLSIGEMPRASAEMSSGVIDKHKALLEAVCPSGVAVVAAVALLVAGVLAAACIRSRGASGGKALKTLYWCGGTAAAVMALAALGVFAGRESWAVESASGRVVADITAPLVNPSVYAWIAAFAVAAVAASAAATIDSARRKKLLAASAALSAAAVFTALTVLRPDSAGYAGEPFDWTMHEFAFAALVAALFALAVFIPDGLCYAIPVAGFHIAAFVLLRRGAMNGLTHPTSWWFWWPVAWNFVVLALVRACLPNGRSVAGAALFAQIGASFYAYMPIVSDLRNPPMNWGYPRTWDGFKHAITRGQYEAIKLPDFESAKAFFDFIRAQTGHYFNEVKLQFTDFLVFFSLVPFASWTATLRGREGGRPVRLRAALAVGAVLAVLLVRAVLSGAGLEGGEALKAFDRVLIGVMAAAAAAGLAIMAFRQFAMRFGAACSRFVSTAARARDWKRLAAFAVFPALAVAGGLRLWTRPGGTSAPFFAALAAVSAATALVLFAPAAARLRRRASRDGFAVRFGAGSVSQQWLLASGACFFMMTIPLILLAQVKGDLQDGFIQKVKFISSHAMVALWIGYGLAIGGAALLRFARGRAGRAAAPALAAAAILCCAVAPVAQNYADDELTEKIGVNELVNRFGGSEQNGHTFGWQFGAYQLDGAAAVREQITADEEPLPDPSWPPPMEPYSIFFGGTDPGRFVPTYMIYAANFRPDVYLITQNALADDTYMAVQRDLYGDEIWIPAKEDSAAAFERYVDEVKRGVRQANGDLRIENGRVQVTGALGVMEINAILTQMMFEHDKDRHAFYIEESYPIRWMYPYLSPHGLIMKINRERTLYDAKTAAKDRDFWSWYSMRLLDDPMYKRDFAAQKSFSKLRAAIAGLYMAQGRQAEAAQAYREAMMLYPAAPEAAFRYTSEMLLPSGRFDAVVELMDYIDLQDPNNKRTARPRQYVIATRNVARLEKKFRDGRQTAEDAFELARNYARLGAAREAAEMLRQILPSIGSPRELLEAAGILSAGSLHAEALQAYSRFFAAAKQPPLETILDYAGELYAAGAIAESVKTLDGAFRSSRAKTVKFLEDRLAGAARDAGAFPLWLRLCKYQFRSGMRPQAAASFETAYSIDPARLRAECAADRELENIARSFINRR